jgi:hypothetical protein
VSMRVSIRRTLRVGNAAGTAVEDLGVVPDEVHQMTRRDVEGKNDDLIEHAVSLLREQPRPRQLDIKKTAVRDGMLKLTLTTAGIDRVDVYVDDRPITSKLLSADEEPVVNVPSAGARGLRLMGYADGVLVANRRESLGILPSGKMGILPGATLVQAPAREVPNPVRFLVAAGDADRETVQHHVNLAWHSGWTVEPLFDIQAGGSPHASLQGYYAVIGGLPRGTNDQRRALAFDMSRELMAKTGYDVQPDLPSGAMYPPVGEYDIEAGDPTVEGSGAQTVHLPGTENAAWALQNMRVPEAWNRSPARGAGIAVAHPDTGVTKDPELQPGLDLTRQRDLLDNDNDATDPLTKRWWWRDNPGHGTGTASVVMSREAGSVTGTAPAADLVPLRAIHSVVLVYDGDVARAVEYARQQGCHVITMSLGGVGFSGALRAAIDAAIDDGLLVLAAAGNQVGFVVSPANYDEVMAVAATNIQDKPWVGSSHGPKVDVSAPGESVHAAHAKNGPNGPEYSVYPSAGTSYAVAQTAGVAALWLAHHGRDNLIAQYGKANLQAVFADLVRTTARRPAGWDSAEYGAGIVNADALLAQALPAIVPPLASASGSLTAAERLAPYTLDQSSDTAAAALDALLSGPDLDRDLYAGELAYHLSQDPQARVAFSAIATSALDDSSSTAEAEFTLGLAQLKAIASPSLAGRLA